MSKSVKIGVLFMLLVIALAAMGVGYGMWAETLWIEGDVNTGEVDIALSIEEIDEGLAGYLHDDGVDEDREFEGKDVGECLASLVPAENNTMLVTLNNAYPYFACFINFNVENWGTIPVYLHQPVIANPSPAEVVVDTTTPILGAGECYFDEVNGVWPGGFETHMQLHPGEMTYCTLYIEVQQAADELSSYEFTVSIYGHQWNEEP